MKTLPNINCLILPLKEIKDCLEIKITEDTMIITINILIIEEDNMMMKINQETTKLTEEDTREMMIEEIITEKILEKIREITEIKEEQM